MNRKTVALLFSFIIIAMIFTGCSNNNKNSEIAGDWVPTTASFNGETVQYAELGIEQDQFGFTFTEDGKCTATLAGITGKGTYVFNETSVDVVINEKPHKLDYKNGTLVLTLDYDDSPATFTFTKADINITE